MSNPLDMCCKTTCDPKAVDEWIKAKDDKIVDQEKSIQRLLGKQGSLYGRMMRQVRELETANKRISELERFAERAYIYLSSEFEGSDPAELTATLLRCAGDLLDE